MSKTILAEVDGFTPVIDTMIQDVGLMTATVFGKVWRYCQMSDGVCTAAQERIADELGVSRATINQHIDKLVQAGYLQDKTPALLGMPHVYRDTGKAGLSISLIARPVKKLDTTCQNSLHLPVKKLDTKIVIKKEKEKRHTHAEIPDFVNLTVQQADHLPELQIFQQATGRFPGCGQWETVWSTIRKMNGTGNAEYLRPFWLEWCARGYNVSGLAWLTDWAVSGTIPSRKKFGQSKTQVKQPRQLPAEEILRLQKLAEKELVPQ